MKFRDNYFFTSTKISFISYRNQMIIRRLGWTTTAIGDIATNTTSTIVTTLPALTNIKMSTLLQPYSRYELSFAVISTLFARFLHIQISSSICNVTLRWYRYLGCVSFVLHSQSNECRYINKRKKERNSRLVSIINYISNMIKQTRNIYTFTNKNKYFLLIEQLILLSFYITRKLLQK